MYIKNSTELRKDKLYSNPGNGILEHYKLSFENDLVNGELVLDFEENLNDIIQSYHDEVAIERLIARAEAGDVDSLTSGRRAIEIPAGVDFDPEMDVDKALRDVYGSYTFKDQVAYEDFVKLVLGGKFDELNLSSKEEKHEE